MYENEALFQGTSVELPSRFLTRPMQSLQGSQWSCWFLLRILGGPKMTKTAFASMRAYKAKVTRISRALYF